MKQSTALITLTALLTYSMGCGQDRTGDVGSESHWLETCEVDDDCPSGQVCSTTFYCEPDSSRWSDEEELATHFVTVWKTDTTPNAVTGPTSLRITTGDGVFDYDVDWDGDGSFDEFGLTGDAEHDYAVEGTYTVRIRGTFPHMTLGQGTDREKLVDVAQWGAIEWGSMRDMFLLAEDMTMSATDAPDLSRVTDMSSMFFGALAFDSPIGHWDTSNVTNMNATFGTAVSFDQPLADWDVSNVTDMGAMFFNTPAFDQPLATWDTSSVTNMRGMFDGAKAFDQPLNRWDTSQVTDMSEMFYLAESFDQPLAGWETSNVTDMKRMFYKARRFDRPIEGWDTSSVTDMSAMFSMAESFDQPLDGWDTSSVTDMSYMFSATDPYEQVDEELGPTVAAMRFDQPLDGWDTSGVTNMVAMFERTASFDQPLDGWEIGAVSDMRAMFDQTSLSRENYDATLDAWSKLSDIPRDVSLSARGLTYCGSAQARTTLVEDHGWTIDGDTLDCD